MASLFRATVATFFLIGAAALYSDARGATAQNVLDMPMYSVLVSLHRSWKSNDWFSTLRVKTNRSAPFQNGKTNKQGNRLACNCEFPPFFPDNGATEPSEQHNSTEQMRMKDNKYVLYNFYYAKDLCLLLDLHNLIQCCCRNGRNYVYVV